MLFNISACDHRSLRHILKKKDCKRIPKKEVEVDKTYIMDRYSDVWLACFKSRRKMIYNMYDNICSFAF